MIYVRLSTGQVFLDTVPVKAGMDSRVSIFPYLVFSELKASANLFYYLSIVMDTVPGIHEHFLVEFLLVASRCTGTSKVSIQYNGMAECQCSTHHSNIETSYELRTSLLMYWNGVRLH